MRSTHTIPGGAGCPGRPYSGMPATARHSLASIAWKPLTTSVSGHCPGHQAPRWIIAMWVPLYLFVLAMWPISGLHAEIYKWIDEKGRVHYGDTKPENQTPVEIVPSDVILAPEAPDEGELRRRALLEPQKPAAPNSSSDTKSSSPMQDKPQCFTARTKLGILEEEMAIYLTEAGDLRPKWNNDYYQGERRYLADAERLDERKRVMNDLRTYCADPEDTTAQQAAYEEWVASEWCAVHRIALDRAKDPQTRTSDNHVESLARKVAEACAE